MVIQASAIRVPHVLYIWGVQGGIGGFELHLLCVVHVLHSWVCTDTIEQITS